MTFDDDDFQAALDTVLSAAQRGAADAGEALATAARVTDGDADSWVQEWTATAGEAWAAGDHFRAASYYEAALRLLPFGSEPERERLLWRRQRDCWDRAAAQFPAPGERIAIPYEGGTLPGYFFRAPGTGASEPRPLVVLNNGSDACTSRMWLAGGAEAADRGYHWLAFDGPGQQAARFEQGLPSRPDWEAVLTPVADAMLARPDVDARRMAVVGVGQAGYLVPRALAFEHRFAAAVADPGVVDVSAPWTEALSDELRAALARGDRFAFDRDMHLAELFSPEMTARLCACGAPYERANGSRFGLFAAVASYRLGDEAAAITTPLLVTDPEGERRWPGQARRLFDRLTGPKELVRLAAGERDARIFDWLDRHLRHGTMLST